MLEVFIDVEHQARGARHSLAEGAAESRQSQPELSATIWALKTDIEKRRQKSTKQAVQVIEDTPMTKTSIEPIRLLHLSDLHFSAVTPIPARLQWLLDDLKQPAGLGFRQLEYLVISGDFTDRGRIEGFEKAYEFVSGLAEEFGLSAERCIFVPGNHDVRDISEAFEERVTADGNKVTVQTDKYPSRLKAFSDDFYHKFLQRPYPTDVTAQGVAIRSGKAVCSS